MGENIERLREIIEVFRQKGATSPEKALRVEELGLPPRSGDTMNRCVGRFDVFVKVNGKYYLDEKRFEELREQTGNRRFRS